MKTNLRQLALLIRFYQGERLSLRDIQLDYETSERSIYRDIKELRQILLEYTSDQLILNKQEKVYELIKTTKTDFNLAEIISISKILLSSRAYSPNEIKTITNKLVSQLNNEDKKMVQFINDNELMHYEPLQHGKDILPAISRFSNFIYNHQEIAFDYTRSDEKTVSRTNRPVALFFSEMYFYVMFYSKNNARHYSYRLDRFQGDIQLTGNNHIDKSQELEDGVFRKNAHYMMTSSNNGRTIRFNYWGLPAVPLDVFPNSKIIEEKKFDEDCTTIELVAFESSAKKWFLGQGNLVEVLSPLSLRKSMIEEIEKMMGRYKKGCEK